MREGGNVGEKTLELGAILEVIQLYGPCTGALGFPAEGARGGAGMSQLRKPEPQ